jgi:superfamily II DNA or RNA helicase
MTKEEKEIRLREISQSTLDETLTKLDKNNRVLVVRPTGFGKSFMLAGLTSNKLDNGEYRFKKSLYIYPTKVIKQDVINTYGPCGKDERAGKLKNTTFISYSKLTQIINKLDNKKVAHLKGLELFDGIIDISSDGDWRPDDCKEIYNARKYEDSIECYQGQGSLRQWIKQFDLIMMDECHKAGATGFLRTWDRIGSIITKSYDNIKDGETPVKLVGVTATPDRLDGRDIKEIFGKSNQISKLSLSDCIKEGLLSKFDYVYTIGDRENFFETAVSAMETKRVKDGNAHLFEYEKSELQKELDKMKPMSDIIRESVTDANTGGENYMRFVVFFEDKKHIQKMSNTVENWFTNAFLDKTVNVVNIVTNSKDSDITYEISDVDILEELDRNKKDNTIDLIFCVDKLNMGYHVESITGIMLLRETNSAVIYNQQIGRCFSVRSNNKPIIFDVVDKAGAGNILAKADRDTDDFSSGEKKELPSIIDSSCVDTHNYGKDFIKLLNSMRKQSYKADEIIVKFLSEDRHAPADVIVTMTGLDINTVNSILGTD